MTYLICDVTMILIALVITMVAKPPKGGDPHE